MESVALYAVIIGLIVPLVEVLVAWVCWKLFKDHPREEAPQNDPYGDPYGYGDGTYGVAATLAA